MKNLEKYIEICFEEFLFRYRLTNKIRVEQYRNESPNTILERLISLIKNIDKKVYLLIDEYDNFLNEILVNQGESVYEQVTHGDGFIRDFFKKIKAMTHSYTIDRIFITGVTPMAMNDLTSGFNIGDNISY